MRRDHPEPRSASTFSHQWFRGGWWQAAAVRIIEYLLVALIQDPIKRGDVNANFDAEPAKNLMHFADPLRTGSTDSSNPCKKLFHIFSLSPFAKQSSLPSENGAWAWDCFFF
jgi:hypothetical protein